MGDPFRFQSIAAIVIGAVSILGGRGHLLSRSPVVSRSSRCSACCGPNMPRFGRSALYGLTILATLSAYGGNDAPPDPTPSIHDASIVGFARQCHVFISGRRNQLIAAGRRGPPEVLTHLILPPSVLISRNL